MSDVEDKEAGTEWFCAFPQPGPALQRGSSSASLHNSQMRGTIVQLMIHTLDPLAEGECMLHTRGPWLHSPEGFHWEYTQYFEVNNSPSGCS